MKGERRRVKGAIIANFSGTNDLPRSVPFVGRGWPGGWINLTGTRLEDYFEKPQYHTYKLLVEKLQDFTEVTELSVSSDPRTRVYKFERPRGPIYVLWSETGEAPPNLDYRIPTGETVTLKVTNNVNALKLTHIISDTANTQPQEEMLPVQNGRVSMQLGYEPIFLEEGVLVGVQSRLETSLPRVFALEQNAPNPFNPSTTIRFSLPTTAQVTLKIFNTAGQEVRTLVNASFPAGRQTLRGDGRDRFGNVSKKFGVSSFSLTTQASAGIKLKFDTPISWLWRNKQPACKLQLAQDRRLALLSN